MTGDNQQTLPWKDKILDYEIETNKPINGISDLQTWKDKILDYEIETCRVRCEFPNPQILEKIRFSITRLKRGLSIAFSCLLSPWKDKILDYEIETTSHASRTRPGQSRLEKIRFSITRLKPVSELSVCEKREAWKDKILDYEIETCLYLLLPLLMLLLEKIRFSITRLKRIDPIRPAVLSFYLKR